jgi:murein endopeptidase
MRRDWPVGLNGALRATPRDLKGSGPRIATVPLVNLAALAVAVLATVQPVPPTQPAVPPPDALPRADTKSHAVGLPFRGRLVGGVPFPPDGPTFSTWDPVLKVSPNRVWRRYATVQTVSRVLSVLATYREAHPTGPRVLVGDLSRPRGGFFGRRYGGLGHASHQNGLDVDVYYPRLDRLEQAARRPEQVDQVLAQDLVDLFLQAGAQKLFVGPNLKLKGPRSRVIALVHHDDHVHVRWPR